MDLGPIWKVIENIWVLMAEISYGIEGTIVVGWHRDVPYFLALHIYSRNIVKIICLLWLTFFLPRDDVFQKENGDLLIGWQIDAGVYGKEVVAFPLAIVLGGELLGGDLLSLRALSHDLTIVVVLHQKRMLFNNDRN